VWDLEDELIEECDVDVVKERGIDSGQDLL
jgi:hypothetical protein